MSTLLEELEQAADEIDVLCPCKTITCSNKVLTQSLRARIEHVRETLAAHPHCNGACEITQLCGPLPEGTPEQKGDR